MDTETPSTERREYYRVDDELIIRYQAIDESQVKMQQPPAEFCQSEGTLLLRELHQIDAENAKLLRKIADQSRETEAYLKAINKKLLLISKLLIEKEQTTTRTPPQKVSLSEGGITFRVSEAIEENRYLVIELTLLPEQLTIQLFAQVMSCQAIANHEFVLATTFINPKEIDRQLLAKHILQVQIASKRNDRGSR